MNRICLKKDKEQWVEAGQMFHEARWDLTDRSSGRKVSLRAAGEECGCSYALLNMIELGRQWPSTDLLDRMIEVYQVEDEKKIRLLYGLPSRKDCEWLHQAWKERLESEPE